MPEYPSDYYEPNGPVTTEEKDPCPDRTCCPSPVGPAAGGSAGGGPPGGSGGTGGSSGGAPGGNGGCGPGRTCLTAGSPDPIRFATGALELVANDLYSPGFGEPWGHTRTYGHRLFQNGVLESQDGVNGRNWFVSTSPYLVEVNSGSHEGTIAVMGNVNATLWFDFVGSDSNEYVNRFHGPETLEHDETAHLFRLTSPDGSVTEFHDFDQWSAPQGLFKRQISPGGQLTEVVSYFGGEIGEVQRSATVNGTTVIESLSSRYEWFGRLSEIILRRKTGSGPWREVQRVVFTYWSTYWGYWNEPDRGSGGDLRSAETFEWNGSAWKHTGTTYYTYYLQDGPQGFVFGLQHVLGPDAVARMVADGQAEFGDFANAYYGWYGENYARSTLRVSNTADLAAYADNTYEYDSQRRVTRETIQGGTLSYQYAYVTSSHPEDPLNWKTKTTQTFPDGTQLLIYSNANGQTLLSVHRAAAGDWIEYAQYVRGYRTLKASPAAVVAYDELQPDLGVILSEDEGLIELFDYSGPDDPIPDKLMAERIQQGAAGTPITLREYEYTSHTAQGATVHPISKETVYRNDDDTGAIETSYDYLWHTGTCRIQQRTVTLPEIPTTQNGPGTSATRTEQFDLYGNLIWSRDERGVITRQKFDPALGVVTQQIDDVDTSIETDSPAGWTTLPGFGLNLITDFEYDQFGRSIRELGPQHTIDVNGVATLIRRAEWAAYLLSASGQEIRQGQGSLKIADSSQTLINPVTIRKQTVQGRLLEEIQALQGWHSGSSGSSSSGSHDEVPVSVPGPVSSDENEFPQESYVRWTTYQYASCCQLISTRRYHAIPAWGTGIEGANYDQTRFDYDTMGRRNRTQSPGGTITFTVFDARSLPEEIWIGTNDNGGTEADPSGAGFEPDNNMVLVTTKEYDNGSAGGNGNLTRQTQYADATDTRVTSMTYDFRSRLLTAAGEIDFFQKNFYDNLNRKVQVERYDADEEGNLISREETLWNDRNKIYQKIRYGVDPATGTVGNALTDNFWYDATMKQIQSLPAGSKLFMKTTHDGLGRPTATYRGYLRPDLSPLSPDLLANDVILEQQERDYDDASNVIESISRQRYHNAPDTQLGALGDPSTAPKARVTYAVNYPDSLGRTQATASYGTNGGDTFNRSETIPERSDTVLVNSQTHDNTGEIFETMVPISMVTRFTYDDAGRQTTLIENYQELTLNGELDEDDCDPSDDTNRTTMMSYTPDSKTATLTAMNASTTNQVTQYLYGTTLDDSEAASSLLLRQVIYPDSTSESDVVLYSYNRLAQRISLSDQNGSVHSYVYDKLGRPLHDRVTTLGTGVDGAVRRFSVEYDVRGLVRTLSSFDNPTVGSGSAVNQVQFMYNDFGQSINTLQAHSGTVDSMSTPSVGMNYADGADNTIRPRKLIYPDGRKVNYDYGAADGINDSLSRIAVLIDDDDTTDLAEYAYLGLNNVIQVNSPEANLQYMLIDLDGEDDPDTGDIYSGVDRFGRITDCRWRNTSTDSDLSRVQYGYDRDSNRAWRKNPTDPNSHYDWLYAYDGLQRLKNAQRGTLNGGHTAITDPQFGQCWTLDATNNWNGFRQDDDGTSWSLIQERTANTVNEITNIDNTTGPAWATPAYDRNGNMTTIPRATGPSWSTLTADGWGNLSAGGWGAMDIDPAAFTATYDAWNRLVKLVDANTSDTVQENSYDARNFRIVRKNHTDGALSETRHFYCTDSWQDIEERLDSSTDPNQQNIWGIRYIDELILRDRTTENPLDERLYACQDANWNVTATIDINGDVQERYEYDPYGNVTFVAPDFTARTTSNFEWTTLFTGRYLDLAINFYYFRRRFYNSALGPFLTRDPLTYANGASLYAAYFIPKWLDPLGTDIVICFRQFLGDKNADNFDPPGFWGWLTGIPPIAHAFIGIKGDNSTTTYSFHPDVWPTSNPGDPNNRRSGRVWKNDPNDVACADNKTRLKHTCFTIPTPCGKDEEDLKKFIEDWIRVNGVGFEEGQPLQPDSTGNTHGATASSPPRPDCHADYWVYGQNCAWWSTTVLVEWGVKVSDLDARRYADRWNGGHGIYVIENPNGEGINGQQGMRVPRLCRPGRYVDEKNPHIVP